MYSNNFDEAYGKLRRDLEDRALRRVLKMTILFGARPHWCLVLGPLELRRVLPFRGILWGLPLAPEDHHTSLIESFHSAQVVSSHLL
jgi:hypothetical protein